MRQGDRPMPCGRCVPIGLAILSLALAACDGTPEHHGLVAPDVVTALFALEPDVADPPQCSGWFDPVCDDDDPCTIQACIDGMCRYGPSGIANCCKDDAACDDSSPCTADTCSPEHTCVYTSLDLPDCCTTHAECQPEGGCDEGGWGTIDYCKDHKCVHAFDPLGCDPYGDYPCLPDANPCTEDACVCGPDFPCTCSCTHTWIPGCCTKDADCDDGSFLTQDQCIGGQCSHTNLAECLSDLDCADVNPCNVDKCVNYKCRHTPGLGAPDCCAFDADCNDGIACTAEYCDQGIQTCVKSLVPNQIPKCCWTDIQCDDDDPFTIDKCVKNQCSWGGEPPCGGFCNDNNPCTTDVCNLANNKKCSYTPIQGCCSKDVDCTVVPLTDGNPCTTDKCVNNKCVFQPIAECCKTSADCGPGGPWDDQSSCTSEYCVANQCKHIKSDPSCCASDKECDDGFECSIDTCEANKCKHAADYSNPLLPCCQADADCDDGKDFTLDKCLNYLCAYVDSPNCCSPYSESMDCNDGNPCTWDKCVFCKCHNLPPGVAPPEAGLPEGCCSVVADCPPSSNPCVTAFCGEGVCQYLKQSPCALLLPFVATFSPCETLDDLWSHLDPADGSGAWWQCSAQGELGPDAHVVFAPEWGSVAPLSALLMPEWLKKGDAGPVTVQWEWAFAHGAGQATIGLYLLDELTPTPAWKEKAAVIKQLEPAQDLLTTRETAQLPPEVQVGQSFRIGFGLTAESSKAVVAFELDNVRICKGLPPEWDDGPGPQDIPLGVPWNIELTAWDPDAADKLKFHFVGGAPSFAVLGPPEQDPDSGVWTVPVTLSPSLPKDVGHYVLTVRVSDGCLNDDILVPVVVSGP